MKVFLYENPDQLGRKAAELTAGILNEAIERRGFARIIMSTGASQFSTISELVKQPVDWTKVEMFHLDEYIGLDSSHPASFIKYLKERFISKVDLKAAYMVDTSEHIEPLIERLTVKINEAVVDVGLIGIGENAHIAFNDPPADFGDAASFKVVTLDMVCRRQQLGEGWFPTLDDVPRQAVSMTVSQIMRCANVISAVPYAVKAKAVRDTLICDVTNMIPATILKTHPNFTLLLDNDSASMIDTQKFCNV